MAVSPKNHLTQQLHGSRFCSGPRLRVFLVDLRSDFRVGIFEENSLEDSAAPRKLVHRLLRRRKSGSREEIQATQRNMVNGPHIGRPLLRDTPPSASTVFMELRNLETAVKIP